MFNNCNSKTNGEDSFFKRIQHNITTIFDIGCRSDSIFTTFEGEVHYFDPVDIFIQNISIQPNSNKHAVFNNFGLGNENQELYYYPTYQSFYDRINSCNKSDDSNKILLKIKKAKEYCIENKLQSVDFVKIDTEGYEFNVLKGFEEYLENVKIIQFEYGGTFLDNNTKLIDVIHYLEEKGFYKFSYLIPDGTHLITDFEDHYQYCNIVAIHKNSDIIPF